MTAARFDLMALADTTTEPTEHTLQSALHDRSDRTDAQEAYALAMTMRSDLDFEARLHSARNRILKLSVQLWEARKALAASQPGRKALATEVVSDYERGFEAGRQSWKEIIDQHLLYTAELEERISLRSGAGTKSDGGVDIASLDMGDNEGGDDEDAILAASGPSDPSPGPDVRETLKAPIKCNACGRMYPDHAPEGDPVCECATRAVHDMKEAQLLERWKGEPSAIFSKHEERNKP